MQTRLPLPVRSHRRAGHHDRIASSGTARTPPPQLQRLLDLQASAGNQAVTRLLHQHTQTPGQADNSTAAGHDTRAARAEQQATGRLPVQRCGPVPCNCGDEERSAHDRQQPTGNVQRDTAQRATPTEFAIRDKFPGAAGEPGLLFFDMNSAALDTAERTKIPALAAPPGQALVLRGSASEEGASGVNTALTGQRIAAVSQELRDAGHTSTRTPEVLPQAGAGNIDYRRARHVEVRVSGTPSTQPDCSTGVDANDGGPAPNPFTAALNRAEGMLDTAIGAVGSAAAVAPLRGLGVTTPADGPLTTLFGSVSTAGAVLGNLGLIRAHLANMLPFTAPPASTPDQAMPGHRCVNTCDALCASGAIAYNEGNGAGASMTLCPGFMSDPDLDERAAVLVHEGSHGTTGLTTSDQSYHWQRLITQLPPALALANADSYTALVRLLDAPGSITLGPAAPDTHGGGMSATEQQQADNAVAWLEQWLMGTQSEVSSLYGVIDESRPAGTWTNGYYEDTMTLLAPRFGLTAPPAVPPHTDQVAVAGIADRYQQLLAAVSGGPLHLEKSAAPATTWSGSSVQLGTDFFAATSADRVDLLLRTLIAIESTIPTTRRGTYAGYVHDVVTHGNLGSP